MDTAVLKDLNETTQKLGQISLEDVQSRHRKERKEMQAKIQALKKNAPKADKKKRKEALEEIAKLEIDLEKKQEQELKEAEEEIDKNSDKVNQPSSEENQQNHNHVDDKDADINESKENQQEPQQRVSKAQKRRDKKSREARQRDEEIKASAEEALHAPKAIEAGKLKTKLKERLLASYNIPSDGDCLYNAIRHQLILQGLASLSVKELRSETANYIEANKDSLIPYMTNTQTGNLLSDQEFRKYCDDARNTPAWGGQIELKALSSILKVPIEVVQADGSPTIQGAELGGSPLIITYHRHMYSLGEHYNSTVALEDAATSDEDNKEGN